LAFAIGGLLLSILASCERTRQTPVEHTDIVSGPSEPSFSEKYDLDISLPVPRDEILKTVDRLGLRFQLLGERGPDGLYPKPYWSKSVDVSKLEKVYLVEGAFDSERRIAERYRFYATRDDQIVYIENDYTYPDP
jgi:hypothetical protein